MANLKIKLRGQDQANFVAGEDQGFNHYQLTKAFSVLNPTRGDAPEQSFEIKDDQIIELNLTDYSADTSNTALQLFRTFCSLHI